MKIAFRNAESGDIEIVSPEAQVEALPPASPHGAVVVDAGRRFSIHESVKVARDRIERRQPRLRMVGR
jgi:hypothetical protein